MTNLFPCPIPALNVLAYDVWNVMHEWNSVRVAGDMFAGDADVIAYRAKSALPRRAALAMSLQSARLERNAILAQAAYDGIDSTCYRAFILRLFDERVREIRAQYEI